MRQQEILERAQRVIEQGPYTDTWESLCTHPNPKWYQDAKLGIFIHWGVYSVPAYSSEWYSRYMYVKGTKAYEHHLAVYGPQDRFGYKDFIPMFRAEKFDPAKWMDLIAESGAKYVMPVSEHHDGFQMYKSELSHWNAFEMGPRRDVLGALRAEAEARGITFCTSNHRAEHCWFFNGGTKIPSDVPENPDFYDRPIWLDGDVRSLQNIYAPVPPREHLENWLARLCELVDRYRPHVVYFYWWIKNVAFRPYLRKFAAFYYNRAAEWGMDVAINDKYDAFMAGSAVVDVERGYMSDIRPNMWQTCTSVAKNSWGYTENNEFKRPEDLVTDLVDIVSKNGNMLLNIGPRADGTITDEDAHVLRCIGAWLRENGEGIYGTRPWARFGEGPTKLPEGAFCEGERPVFTAEDFRYTFKPGKVFAFCMNPPEDGVLRMKAFARTFTDATDYNVVGVRMMDGTEVPFDRDETCMTVRCGASAWRRGYPAGVCVELD